MLLSFISVKLALISTKANSNVDGMILFAMNVIVVVVIKVSKEEALYKVIGAESDECRADAASSGNAISLLEVERQAIPIASQMPEKR